MAHDNVAACVRHEKQPRADIAESLRDMIFRCCCCCIRGLIVVVCVVLPSFIQMLPFSLSLSLLLFGFCVRGLLFARCPWRIGTSLKEADDSRKKKLEEFFLPPLFFFFFFGKVTSLMRVLLDFDPFKILWQEFCLGLVTRIDFLK